MSIACGGRGGKQVERPPACRGCGLPAWWNGSRLVSVVRARRGVVEFLTNIVRRRARCSSKTCSAGSWTVYDEDSYPHRVFRLLVLVSAVSAVVVGKATLTAAAEAHQCSRRTVGRWKRWVGELAEPKELMRACTRLEADGLPGALVSAEMGRPAAVVHLLDRLADLLTERGVRFRQFRCGLVRILADQLIRFGKVFYITKLSPRLRADMEGMRI